MQRSKIYAIEKEALEDQHGLMALINSAHITGITYQGTQEEKPASWSLSSLEAWAVRYTPISCSMNSYCSSCKASKQAAPANLQRLYLLRIPQTDEQLCLLLVYQRTGQCRYLVNETNRYA
jgi:hypothetical protein